MPAASRQRAQKHLEALQVQRRSRR